MKLVDDDDDDDYLNYFFAKVSPNNGKSTKQQK